MIKSFVVAASLALATLAAPAIADPGHHSVVKNKPMVVQPTMCKTFEQAMSVVATNFEYGFEASLNTLKLLILEGKCINFPQAVFITPVELMFEQDGVMIIAVVAEIGGESAYMLIKDAVWFETMEEYTSHNGKEVSN